MKNGKFDIAAEYINDLLVHDPYNAELLYDAGMCAYRLTKYDVAERYFVSAAEHANNNTEIQAQSWYNAGNAAYKQSQFDRAVQYFQNALDVNPDDQYAKHNKQKMEELKQQQKKILIVLVIIKTKIRMMKTSKIKR